MSTPRHRPRSPCWALLPAALLFGCAAPQRSAPTGSPPPPKPGVQAQAQPANKEAPTPEAARSAGAATGSPAAAPLSVPQLFAKRTVTGLDLIFEFKRLRQLSAKRDTGLTVRQILASDGSVRTAVPVPAAPAKPVMSEQLAFLPLERAFKHAEAELKRKLIPVRHSQLQAYLDGLTGDLQALRAETIQLPSAQGLTPPQMQRAVTLAALVIATRMTHRLMKQAQQDLASLDNEYKELIERRERAAQLLQQALTGTVAPGVFSAAELTQLRQLSQRMSVGEFAKDMGAQNLALRLAKANDPGAFADYQQKSEGLTRRQTASLRIVGGTVAYSALLVKFGSEMARLAHGRRTEMLAMSPLVLAFFAEAPGVLKTSFDVYVAGTNALISGGAGFRVTVEGQTQEVPNAAAVFDLMAQHGAAPELQRALFRDGNRGLLQSVHACDPTATGQMLDLALSTEQREAFATEMSLPDGDQFSFANVLGSGDDANARLAEELLGRDHRPRLADRRLPMARVQFAVAGDGPPGDGGGKPGFLRWNNDQLLRLVFVNRDGSAAQYAAMEVAGVVVRPVPSMQSLYAYETLADACRAQFSAPAESRPLPLPNKPTAPRVARPALPVVPANPITRP